MSQLKQIFTWEIIKWCDSKNVSTVAAGNKPLMVLPQPTGTPGTLPPKDSIITGTTATPQPSTLIGILPPRDSLLEKWEYNFQIERSGIYKIFRFLLYLGMVRIHTVLSTVVFRSKFWTESNTEANTCSDIFTDVGSFFDLDYLRLQSLFNLLKLIIIPEFVSMFWTHM